MKKFIIAAIAIITLSTSAFAEEGNNVSNRILSNFKTLYTTASNIEWVVKNDFTKATFLNEGVKTEVFFDDKGELIGTSKVVAAASLPENAIATIAKKYAGYTIIEAIEFNKVEEGTKYYVSMVSTKGKSRILEVTKSGSVSSFK